MPKYIDADKLAKRMKASPAFKNIIARDDFASDLLRNVVLDLIDNAPTADVVEVRHGEWIHTDKTKHWVGKDECSVCTYHTFDRDDLSHFNYCPNCGAKMDGGRKDNELSREQK